MVIVKQVMLYPTVLSRALVVAATRLKAVSLQTEPMSQQQHPMLYSLRWLWIGSIVLGAAIVLSFKLTSQLIFSAFTDEQQVISLLHNQEWLMCFLAVSNLMSGVISGLVYGLHQFCWLSCVSLCALGAAFTPVLLYGLLRAEGLTLRLLLYGNLAYITTQCLGNLLVLVWAQPRSILRTTESVDVEDVLGSSVSAQHTKSSAATSPSTAPLLP